MRSLERRVRTLEMEADPPNCFDCAMRELNVLFGDSRLSEPCLHSRKTLDQHITELDAALARGDYED